MKRLCTFTILLTIGCGVANAQPNESQFRSDEITFKSTGDVSLSGSLTIPKGKGPFPAIVLLGGSERFGRTAVYNWADAGAFVEQGIAVFSFDSPGRGKSEGDRWGRTKKERTDDALAAVKAIAVRNDINEESVGLYGTSEGGLIAFRAVAESKDIAFAVTISAPAKDYSGAMDSHIKALCRASELQGKQLKKLETFSRLTVSLALGTSEISEMTKTAEQWDDPNWNKLISLLKDQTKENQETTKEAFVKIAQNWQQEEWFQSNRMLRNFQMQAFKLMGLDLSDLGVQLSDSVTAKEIVDFDAAVTGKLRESNSSVAMVFNDANSSKKDNPSNFLKKITCPMLCIYGELDHKMSTYPAIVRRVFSETGHSDSTVKVFEGAGHQLEVNNGRPVKGGDQRKYRHKEAEPLILDWILKRIPATP